MSFLESLVHISRCHCDDQFVYEVTKDMSFLQYTVIFFIIEQNG